MAELNARDTKLIQFLNEAYGKEKQLETALAAHIAMTTRAPYKKKLQEHLRETKGHARELERRIKKLGGKAEGVSVPGGETASAAAAAVANVANRATALAQGPLHAVRGTSEPEKMLRNARDEFSDEAHEIAIYHAIEALATAVKDRDTAALAKRIRREEERMSKFLERLIPQLTKAVATAEIPASERRGTSARSARSSTSARSARSSTSARSGSSRSTSGRSGTASKSRTSGTTKSRASGTKSRTGTSSRSSSSRSGTSSRSSSARSSSARSGSGTRAASSRSGSSRAASSRSGSSSKRSGGGRSSSS